MSRVRPSAPSSRALVAGALAVLLVALAGHAPLFAQGGPSGPPAGASDPSVQLGTRFFDDAIRYVSRGRTAIPQVRDLYARLDAKLDLDASHLEGQLRVWFQMPNLYRTELEANGGTTTKVLNGDAGWIRTPSGHVQNLALSTEGQRQIEQLKDDRARMADLAQYLTLHSLKGPGVTFHFDGYKRGSGMYAGNWIKVTRRAPSRSNTVFWLAFVRDAENEVRASWPGIVRVEGDPAQGYPTEDYLLKEWDSPLSQAQREFVYPRRIEGWSILKDAQGNPAPTRFLHAVVDDIKINAGVDASRFAAPR